MYEYYREERRELYDYYALLRIWQQINFYVGFHSMVLNVNYTLISALNYLNFIAPVRVIRSLDVSRILASLCYILICELNKETLQGGLVT